MGKTLGLDLGTASIGWAIIDEKQNLILDAGVRVFPEGSSKIGTQKEKTNNALRRGFRLARRQTYRRRLRKIKLLETLIDKAMCPLSMDELRLWKNYRRGKAKQFPNSKEFVDWLGLNPYELRNRGVEAPLSRHEFGRVLYQIIHHRGFKTGRKSKDDGTLYSGKKEILGIDHTKERLSESATLGSYLHSVSQRGEENVRGRYTLRQWYIDEFNLLWDRQHGHLGLAKEFVSLKKHIKVGGPEGKKTRDKIKYLEKGGYTCKLSKDGVISYAKDIPLKEYLGDREKGILFYQKPLRSQKHLLAPCRFEPQKTPAPLSHPDFEKFRSLQFINTIEFGAGQRLYPSQREQVLKLINRKQKSFKFEEIKNELEMGSVVFNYSDDHPVAANYTCRILNKYFPEDIANDPPKRDEIWHDFYFYNSPRLLLKKCQDKWNIKSCTEEEIEKIRLKEGYSNVSLKAIRNMLPFMEKGDYYSTAAFLGGVRNVLGDRFDENAEIKVRFILKQNNAEGEAIEKIGQHIKDAYGVADKDLKKLYHHSQEVERKDLTEFLEPPPNLRNPIVQSCLHELKRLVNTLIRTHLNGDEAFEAIKVEMARELKLPRKARVNIEKENANRREINDKAREVLDEFGLAHSKSNINKYLLFKEIEERNGVVCCPYTGKTVSLSELLGGGNKFQIEHIIPFSVSLDDSFFNKTICESNENRNKGEKTPYQFYGNDIQKWNEVKERAFKLLPYEKAKRFVSKKDYRLDDFISRQLNDTRYISKAARDYLSSICYRIAITQGALTADLRHKWGLNTILAPPKAVKGSPDNGSYWGILDDQERIRKLKLRWNKRPQPGNNQVALMGKIEGGDFSSPGLAGKISLENNFDNEGPGWTLVDIEPRPLSLTPVFTPLEQPAKKQFWLRGKITKVNGEKGRADFISKLFAKKLEVRDDGFAAKKCYWLLVESEKEPDYQPFSEKPPKLEKNQTSVLGKVDSGIIFVGIDYRDYSWPVELTNGQWWVILTFNFDFSKSVAVKNDPPKVGHKEVLVEGEVRENLFQTELNRKLRIPAVSSVPDDRYWALFSIRHSPTLYVPKQNKAPDKKINAFVEGTVSGKTEGEKQFFPSKNREDHRHHAVDALVVACTNMGKLQAISKWNAWQKDRKRTGGAEKPSFAPPWKDFRNDAERAVSKILVSHKRSTKVLTKITRSIRKDGKDFKSEGWAAGGQLHKETVFGRRKVLKTGGENYRTRKSILEVKNEKHLAKVADDGIRRLIEQELGERGIDPAKKFTVPKDFFFENGRPKLFLPNKKGNPTPIKKVRFKENIGNAVRLKKDKNQWVNPRNNHHVIIYEDQGGQLKESILTFWEAVERRQGGEEVCQLPPGGVKIVAILQENDMFLIGLSRQEANARIRERGELSPHLYRVQKISLGYYTFRRHLESTIEKDREPYMYRIVSLNRWSELNPIKVAISILGEIEILET